MQTRSKGVFLSLSVLIYFLLILNFSNIAQAQETQTVVASWYKYGSITASQEKFNAHKLTVAHRTLPFGTMLKITNPRNNRTIIARVNDRGPYIKGRDLDVTLRCALKLGITKRGVEKLKIQIIS